MRVSAKVFNMRNLSILLLVLFASVGIFYTVLESNYGIKKAVEILAEALEDSGWKVEHEKSEGSLLRRITLHGVKLSSPEGDEISIRLLHAQLSLLRLLKREIAFTEFAGDGVEWVKKEARSIEAPSSSSVLPQNRNQSSGIPFAIFFSDLRLTSVTLPYSEGVIADLRGKLKVARYNRRAFCKIEAIRRDFPHARASASLLIDPEKRTELRGALFAPNLAVLLPWIPLPIIGAADVRFYSTGNWDAFSSSVFGGKREHPIHSTLEGKVSIVDSALSIQTVNSLLKRTWSLHAAIDLETNGDTRLAHLVLNGDQLLATGHALLGPQGELKEAVAQVTCEDLRRARLAPIDGSLVGEIVTSGEETSISLTSNHLSMDPWKGEELLFTLKLRENMEGWNGHLDGVATVFGEAWKSSADLSWEETEGLKLEHLLAESPSMKVESPMLNISPSFLLVGQMNAAIANIHLLDPTNRFYGPFNASAVWNVSDDGTQTTDLTAAGTNLFYGPFQIEEAHLSLLFPQGGAQGTLNNIRYESLLVETATFDTTFTQNSWPAHISCTGDWKGPLDLTLDGFWHYSQKNLFIDLQNFSGVLFFHPISLAGPAQFQRNPQGMSLSALALAIGEATALASFNFQKEESKIQLLLDLFPLDFLSINPLELSVQGTVHLDAEFVEKGDKTQGKLQAEIRDVEIATELDVNPIRGDALIDVKIDQNRLELDLNVQARSKPLMQCTASLPVRLSLYPFDAEFLLNQPAKSHLAFDGRIEDLLDFFDLGAHRFEGTLRGELSLKNSLSMPLLSGQFLLESGTYENYYTGTKLQNLQGDLVASGHSLELRSLSAYDNQRKGRFSLTGEGSALLAERFPFHIDGEFSRLNVADIEWVQAEAGGTIHIVGNADSARFTGQAIILEVDATIPSRLPPSIPKLQVKYVNVQKPPEVIKRKPHLREKPYPIFFDYHVFAPDGVFVSGRGLSSEWKGDFQMGGTYTDIEARGQLELLTGEFLFSGRAFQLTEGSLSFSGKPHEFPILNVAARYNLPNVAIIARLKGFINSPQLSLQSSPALPMGSILSYLLFGQDLSDINAIQAAQLVNSITTLTGQSSDVMENTRRSISVDRLRIIATPLGPEGGETYALQVGKYVTRGVLVSVSQGTETSSTNVAVEVDLFNGFIFQAESQREQEQGKFTLKWNLNY
jgi:translocation and assembly module TamB